jgi:uncharacterized protein YkwD
LCALVTLASSAPAAAATATERERALLSAMNTARRAHGLRPLRFDPRLQQAARAHSRDMVRRTYFAHGPMLERLRRFRVQAPVVGENLAWGTGNYGSPATIVEKWLESPPHRRTLLRPGFFRVGVGAIAAPFQGNGEATVVTADFAGT